MRETVFKRRYMGTQGTFWKQRVPSLSLSRNNDCHGPTWRKGPPSLKGAPVIRLRKAGLTPAAQSIPPACFQWFTPTFFPSAPASSQKHQGPHSALSAAPRSFSCRSGTFSSGSCSSLSPDYVLTLLIGTDAKGNPSSKPVTVLTVRGPDGNSDRFFFFSRPKRRAGCASPEALLSDKGRNWCHLLLGHQESEQTWSPTPGCLYPLVCWSGFSPEFSRSFFVFLKSVYIWFQFFGRTTNL